MTNTFIHLPNAKVSLDNPTEHGWQPLGRIDESAPWVVYAEAMPTKAERTYKIDLSTEFINPELMAMLFGDPGGLQPYAGVTIQTGPAPEPTLSDYAWSALAARVRYELEWQSKAIEALWKKYAEPS